MQTPDSDPALVTAKTVAADDKAEWRERLKDHQHEEEYLKDNDGRWVILPIKYTDVWDMFKKHEMAFWTAEDFDYVAAEEEFVKETINPIHRDTAKRLMAYQAIRDSRVFNNFSLICCKLLDEVQIPEARAFYSFQCAFEQIHLEVYSHLLDVYEPEEALRPKIFESVMNMKGVQMKKKWVTERLMGDRPFAERMAALTLVKRILNLGGLIFRAWCLESRVLPVLCEAYRNIGRDERLHADFCSLLYGGLRRSLPTEEFTRMVIEAVNIEVEFIQEMFDLKAMKLTEVQVRQFVEFAANSMLDDMQIEKTFQTVAPLQWMKQAIVAAEVDANPNSNAGTSLGCAATEKVSIGKMRLEVDEDF